MVDRMCASWLGPTLEHMWNVVSGVFGSASMNCTNVFGNLNMMLPLEPICIFLSYMEQQDDVLHALLCCIRKISGKSGSRHISGGTVICTMRQALDSIVDSLQDFLGSTLSEEDLRSDLRIQFGRHGDVAYACHRLAQELAHEGMEADIAAWLAEKVAVPDLFSGVRPTGAFLNFTLDTAPFAQHVLPAIMEGGYGTSTLGRGKKVVIDYSAPNVGKPLHIGHIRSTILGDSVGRILRHTGHETYGINYLGDVGLHIGKLLWSYQRFVDPEAFTRDPDSEILRLYVKFGEEHSRHTDDLMANPDQEESEQSPMLDEARSLQYRLESGDPELQRIYEGIYQASMQTFGRIYGMLDVSFDETTGQGSFSRLGKEMVQEALEIGVAERTDDGAVIVNTLAELGLPPKVILRSDGAALYSTQDMGAAEARFREHGFDQMIYVVADEQDVYFQQLFGTLKLMGRAYADRMKHLSFGFINLKDVRMSSRQGNVVYLEDVLHRAKEYAKDLIEDDSMSEQEREEVSEAVGIGAIKYMVLAVAPKKMIEFSWDRALNMDANSSPSIQYSYARANSLVRGVDITGFDAADLERPVDIDLVKRLSQYPIAVEAAARRLEPHIIGGYASDLARTFNRFYHGGKIMGSPEQGSRLYLTECFRRVAADALGLLGIRAPEKM